MTNKLKIAAAALTIVAGTFAASIGSAKAEEVIYIGHHHHHFNRARMECRENGGIYRGDGVCAYPRHVGYRYYYPERTRYYNNGYWSHGVWYND